MKKILAITLVLALALSAAVTVFGVLRNITGQTSVSQKTIYPGVTNTHYTLGSDTTYGLQDINIVEFDPKQEGLSVSVTTGYNNLNSLSTVSNTLSRWRAAHPEKVPIAAINGDWFTVGYDGYSTAMTKKQLNIPLGFNMHGGEIITTQQTQVETSNSGYAPSFGIASDGTPLIGCIDTTATFQFTSVIRNIDGINRLPADNAIILYTDRGPTSNYCLDDAFEVYIDFDSDYVVKDGMSVTGTVTAVSAPGEARLPMQQNRMILTARGSRISEVSSVTVGRRIRIRCSISDRYGNTDKWKTVTDCVGGHHEFARNGQYFAIGDGTRYPAPIIGITADNRVIFLVNDGRQSGYSTGIRINQMPVLAEELGIVSGMYLDGGGSTTLVELNSSGGYDLINRPCNNNHAQRTVSNAVILAYDAKPLMVTDDLLFDSEDYEQYLGTRNNVTAGLGSEGLAIITTTVYDPFLEMKNFGLSADEYKYIVFDAKTTYTGSESMNVALYLAAGATPGATENCKTTILFPETGENVKVLADLSSLSLWNGDIHSIRVDIFDNFASSPSAAVGRGLLIREMRFFRTREEAEAYVSPPAPPAPVMIGDVDGDESVSMKDIKALKGYVASSGVEIVIANSDINGDGSIDSADIKALKRIIAGAV